MCRAQCLLAFLALSAGAAQSWDVAMTNGDHLELFVNKTKTNIGIQQAELTALTYDAVHNMLFFVDNKNDNASIFSYHLATNKYQPLVRKKVSKDINGIAFDPVESLLFWTDTSTYSIYSMSLKQGSNTSAYGNLWLKLSGQFPMGIAIDSCRGYVYWTNALPSGTIERARFDGSERMPIVTGLYRPNSLAIDQRSKRLYWTDDEQGIHFLVESTDLDGGNRLRLFKGTHHKSKALTVSNDSVYWIDSSHETVWKLPKTAWNSTEAEEYTNYSSAFGIAARYLIQDQTEGIPECEGLRSLSPNNSTFNESFNVSHAMELFCVHGEKINDKQECKCDPGYIGDRCDLTVCHNYCFQGECHITKAGQPICRCNEGFSGDRCEVNNAQCTLHNETPVCDCKDFNNKMCETVNVIASTADPILENTEIPITEKVIATELNPSDEQTVAPTTEKLQSATDGEFVMPTSCDAGWDAIRDPIIMVLGVLCGLLVLTCAVLITKVLQLKKRPRIKKRIIVNKNVTPLTARPDQCEITIENCCNMNICETPCFEPRSTIRPNLLGAKAGKEEKKNLIANMEFPDDY